jgi:hypothetical protein
MPAVQEKTEPLELSLKERTVLGIALFNHQLQLEEDIRWFNEPKDKSELKIIRAIRARLLQHA